MPPRTIAAVRFLRAIWLPRSLSLLSKAAGMCTGFSWPPPLPISLTNNVPEKLSGKSPETPIQVFIADNSVQFVPHSLCIFGAVFLYWGGLLAAHRIENRIFRRFLMTIREIEQFLGSD